MKHRGPDAGGQYLDPFVGFAHRRLSIIDLSSQGNQPMVSADGRHVIVFNGEIYNFLTLREELGKQGVFFRTRTDTEVILALYQQMGTRCLQKLNGMFAFAIWDTAERLLFIARDRIGKKPLYYYHGGGDRLAFASEIKSLLQLPEVTREVDLTAIADFLKYLYVPAPKSIYHNIFKLLPGHFLTLRAGGVPTVTEYWDVDFTSRQLHSREEAQEALLDLLQDATACRMVSDVPLGAFLSGGIDSSAVVALMSKASPDGVRTCSIGFTEEKHDETPFAREVADLFGTEHQEYVGRENLVEAVRLLPKYFDEPFADSSAVPTYHVSRLARQGVTVALAGDGGDESFAGYDKYAVELKEDLARRLVPRRLLTIVAAGASAFTHPLAGKLRSFTGSALEEPGRAFYRTNTHLHDQAMYQLLSETTVRSCSGYDPALHTLRHWERVRDADHVTRMLYTDLKTYLPDDILVKVDRMSMANSLEVRAPFLDYRIIELAASLPSGWKIKGSRKKLVLKDAFSRLLPKSILHRPKHGFTVPLNTWFRNELRGLAQEHLLGQESLSQYLNLHEVTRIWREHQEQRAENGTLLWSLLMLALWQREYQQI